MGHSDPECPLRVKRDCMLLVFLLYSKEFKILDTTAKEELIISILFNLTISC